MSRYRVERETRLDVMVAELMGTAADGALEATLDANPGLASIGPMLPIGTVIEAPELPEVETVGTRVWE